MSKLKVNPCITCRERPSTGFYAGDFAVECRNCLTDLCRHFIDYPHKHFQTSARHAKEAAIQAWNTLNPLSPTTKG